MFYVVLAFVLFVVLLAGSGLVSISENVSLPGFTAKSEGLCNYGIDRGAEQKNGAEKGNPNAYIYLVRDLC